MDLWLVGAIDTPATPGAALLAAAAPRLGTKGGVEAIAHYGGATGKLNRKGLVLGTVAGGAVPSPVKLCRVNGLLALRGLAGWFGFVRQRSLAVGIPQAGKCVQRPPGV